MHVGSQVRRGFLAGGAACSSVGVEGGAEETRSCWAPGARRDRGCPAPLSLHQTVPPLLASAVHLLKPPLPTAPQGMPTSLIVEGAARLWGLLEEIDAACGGRRVRVMDIGGGLTCAWAAGRPGCGGAGRADPAGPPTSRAALASAGPLSELPFLPLPAPRSPPSAPSVDFSTDTPGPFTSETPEAPGGGGGPCWSRFQEQAALLRARVPGLFDPARGVRLMTEVRRGRMGGGARSAVRARAARRSLLQPTAARRVTPSPSPSPHQPHPPERPLPSGQGGLRRQPRGVHKNLWRAA
jgi:hypothetical protein